MQIVFLHSKHTASLQRRCNVATLQRRYNDVVATLYVCWVWTTLLSTLFRIFFFAWTEKINKMSTNFDIWDRLVP